MAGDESLVKCSENQTFETITLHKPLLPTYDIFFGAQISRINRADVSRVLYQG